MDVPAREDVVHYLQSHLKEYPVEDLRKQLAAEGVSETEFDEALKTALRTPAPAPPPTLRARRSARSSLARVLIVLGAFAVLLGVALSLRGSRAPAESAVGPASAPSTTPSSGFVGRSGYVVRLPEGYTAVQSFKDQERRIEVVHFCKAGLDPTSLLDEGLYGPLGIVRLEVQPNPFTASPMALDPIAALATGKAKERGEQYTLKNLQISSLPGIQLTFDAPNPRVVSYVVGRTSLYTFYAGQDDEIYRSILNSLRDAQSEN